jgi:hypothetical protein
MLRWLKRLPLYAVVAALLAYSWMPEKIGVPNERSRIYQAVAIVDHGTVAIDQPYKRFGTILDVSIYRGHRYTDKAPGMGFLAAGMYGALRVFTAPGDWRIADIINLIRTWLMIPVGLLGFLLLRRVLHSCGVSTPVIDIASLSWILGSAAFHYSSAVYGHQISAVLFLLVVAIRQRMSEHRLRATLQYLVVGLAAGLAGFTEFQSALWCVPLAALVVKAEWRRPERLAAFAVGAGVFVAFLLWYNYCAYDDPFSLSYHHLSKGMQGRHSAGIAGVSWPSASAFLGILFSAHRGLFATSPIFTLALPGFVYMWRRGQRELAVFIGAAFVGFLLFISGAEIWHGGWAYGPRLMVPLLGVLAVPVAFSLEHLRRSPILLSVAAGLGAFGILCNQLVHLVLQELPTHCLNPIMDVVVPAFRTGAFSPNLFSEHLGVGGYAGIVLALFLTVIAVCVVVARGLLAAEGSKSRLIRIGAALVVVGGLMSAVAFYGASWSPGKTQSFLKKHLSGSGAEDRRPLTERR